MENTPPPILGHNTFTGNEVNRDPNAPKLEVSNRNDAIFLIAFMGLTPFGLFGIHDFILGQKKKGKTHLAVFGIVILLMMIMGTSSLIARIFVSDHKAIEELAATIAQYTETISTILVGVSYLISVLEAISYIGNIDSYIKIVKPKDDLEDEGEDEEESTEEIEDDSESKITP